MIYAVYVDERDKVWLSDFGANALVALRSGHGGVHERRAAERRCHRSPDPGRRGEVWGAESGTDKLVVVDAR